MRRTDRLLEGDTYQATSTNPTSELKWLQLPAGRNAHATISVGSNPGVIFFASLFQSGEYRIADAYPDTGRDFPWASRLPGQNQ